MSRRGRVERGEVTRAAAGEPLAQERDLLRALMDNLPDLIYFKDTASRFIRLNRPVATVPGYNDPEEVVGKSDFDHFPAELAEQFRAEELRVLEHGELTVNRLRRHESASPGISPTRSWRSGRCAKARRGCKRPRPAIAR